MGLAFDFDATKPPVLQSLRAGDAAGIERYRRLVVVLLPARVQENGSAAMSCRPCKAERISERWQAFEAARIAEVKRRHDEALSDWNGLVASLAFPVECKLRRAIDAVREASGVPDRRAMLDFWHETPVMLDWQDLVRYGNFPQLKDGPPKRPEQ